MIRKSEDLPRLQRNPERFVHINPRGKLLPCGFFYACRPQASSFSRPGTPCRGTSADPAGIAHKDRRDKAEGSVRDDLLPSQQITCKNADQGYGKGELR